MDFDIFHDTFNGGRDVTKYPSVIYAWDAQNGAITSLQGQPLYLSSQSSISMEKYTLQSCISLRAGYRFFPMDSETIGLQIGPSLDFVKAKSETFGTLAPHFGDNEPVVLDGRDYYEGWAFSRNVSKTTVGGYVGISVRLGGHVQMELNLRSFTVPVASYAPFAYTGQPAHIQEGTQKVQAVELGVGWIF